MSDIPESIPQKTVYNETVSPEPTPIAQITSVNGLTDRVDTFTFNGGTAQNGNSEFNVSTGTNAFAFAAILSDNNIGVRPGQGGGCLIDARFTAGVDDSAQFAGFISSTDSLTFGYADDPVSGTNVFGVQRRHDGNVEIQELQITSATTGAGDVTVTVNAIPYTVPVTVASVQVNALEISDSLNSLVPNYAFTSNDDTVTAAADIAQSQGAFAFALDTATGTAATWTQIKGGNTAANEVTPQADWNVDPKPTLNPLNGNVFMIKFQYGYGLIQYFVQNESTGRMDLVHQIDYTNKFQKPNLGDPSMTVGWTVSSQGSTTDLDVHGASAEMFIEGKNVSSEIPKSLTNTVLGVGLVPQNLITLRNRIVRGDKGNRRATALLEVSGLTTSTKGALIDVLIDATVAGDPDFQYIDKTTSNTEFDITGTVVTGGTSIGTVGFSAGDSDSIDLSKFMEMIQPDQTVTLATSVIATPASDNTGIISFRENS